MPQRRRRSGGGASDATSDRGVCRREIPIPPPGGARAGWTQRASAGGLVSQSVVRALGRVAPPNRSSKLARPLPVANRLLAFLGFFLLVVAGRTLLPSARAADRLFVFFSSRATPFRRARGWRSLSSSSRASDRLPRRSRARRRRARPQRRPLGRASSRARCGAPRSPRAPRRARARAPPAPRAAPALPPPRERDRPIDTDAEWWVHRFRHGSMWKRRRRIVVSRNSLVRIRWI